MAHSFHIPARPLDQVRAALSTFAHRLAENSAAQKRVDYAARLHAKSDAELAELGIRRQDIVRHAFRGMIHW